MTNSTADTRYLPTGTGTADGVADRAAEARDRLAIVNAKIDDMRLTADETTSVVNYLAGYNPAPVMAALAYIERRRADRAHAEGGHDV